MGVRRLVGRGYGPSGEIQIDDTRLKEIRVTAQ
jgi:hypothetical protein